MDADVLTVIAGACRSHERLRFDYTRHDGTTARRLVEPHRLVHMNRRWYLVAWDTDRRDWRIFRADRIDVRTPTGPRFTPREPPSDDIAGYLQRNVGAAVWRYHARIRLHAPAEAVADRLPPSVLVETIDEHSCMLRTGASTLQALALNLGLLDVDFEIVDAPDFAAHLGKLIGRYERAIERTTGV
ncbi:MAG: WYL domain-containing protein [Pseudonocardiaceae bacterium]|nr:WYL domain-containing protein [Pseudonocardiaceae bacterium]